MKTLLISGFQPWGPHAVNSSNQLVRSAKDIALPEGWRVKRLILPVAWQTSADRLLTEAVTADAVIAFGLAADRTHVTPELRAANVCRNSIDGNGNPPSQPNLSPNGPEFLESTLPLEEMVKSLQSHAIPVHVSHDAGGFICNEVFYRLLHSQAVSGRRIPAGFVHLPPWDLWPEEQWKQVLAAVIAPILLCPAESTED